MLYSIMISILGLVLLVIGGEFVVRGASNLAKSFGISQLVVGLTIVAFGTSAPELGVSLLATLKGNTDIAISNVVGSNIFNTAFILGICALVSPLVVNLQLLKIDIPIFIFASILAFIFSYDGLLSFWEGLILFVSVIVYTVWLIQASRKENSNDSNELQNEKKLNERFVNLVIVVGGIITLVYGSKFLVQGASSFASMAGVSDAVIGLTLVAAGTSLPELVSSLMATVRGKTDIAIGNVIGSGIFNLLFILGSSTLININGLVISDSILKLDFPIMVFLALLSYPLLITGKKLLRWEGALLMFSYVGYVSLLLNRG